MTYCQICRRHYSGSLTTCPKHGLQLVAGGSSDPLVGSKLANGTYEIRALIGSGGMGRVYRATQHPLDRAVAIKVIQPAKDTSGMLKRFYREARLLARIDHANVVTLHDFGNTDDGMFFMVMQFLTGAGLDRSVVPGDGLSVPEAIRVFDQICAGVSAAHAVGMLHRDLKPSNVFIAEQSGGTRIVKVLDFGLAKAVGEGHTIVTTTDGMLLGTPGYIAPELIGQSSDHATTRSDVYALGAILYFLLTGQHVHSRGTSEQILARQLMEALNLNALAARHADLHPKLLRILILKAMALAPEERHASSDELLHAFRFATSR